MDSFGTFKINTCIPIKSFSFLSAPCNGEKATKKMLQLRVRKQKRGESSRSTPFSRSETLHEAVATYRGWKWLYFFFSPPENAEGDSKPLPSLLPLYVLSNQPLFFFPFLEAEAATPSPSPLFRQREWDARDPQKTIAGSTAQWGEKKERGKSERKKKCMGRRLPTTNLRRL